MLTVCGMFFGVSTFDFTPLMVGSDSFFVPTTGIGFSLDLGCTNLGGKFCLSSTCCLWKIELVLLFVGFRFGFISFFKAVLEVPSITYRWMILTV